MLVILLVLSAFLSGIFTLNYVINEKDAWRLSLLIASIIITIIITILTYAEAYYY